jgi:thiol-disulfide isomerase/thioredoxin
VTGDSGVRAPEFIGEQVDWINTEPLGIKDLRGKVVLVDFWDYTCVNCIRTLPYLKEWYRRYRDKGLVIVGIHTPEFEFAKSPGNVAAAVKRFGIEFPVLLDGNRDNWTAYANQYWPHKYLVDETGRIIYDHIGEGGYATTEAKIQELLKQVNPAVDLPPLMEPVRGADAPGAVCYPVTPELYAGLRGYRSGHLGQADRYNPGGTVAFRLPDRELDDGKIYLSGFWLCTAESLRHARISPHGEDYVAVKYHAKECNAVLKPEPASPVRVYVTQDGGAVPREDAGRDVQYDENGRSYLQVDRPAMYNLTANREHGQHVIRLYADTEDLGLYAFTFSSCEVPR